MNRVIFFILFFTLGFYSLCFSQSAISEIGRTEEIIEEEKALRKRLEEGRKVFIKKIIVEGVSLLSQEQIEQIMLPFQKHWLSKEEIQQIVDLIVQAYRQEGHRKQPAKIFYEIKKKSLEIQVEELPPQ